MKQTKYKNVTKKQEILGILLMTLGILILIGLVTHHSSETPDITSSAKTNNKLGIIGVYISYYLIHFVIGYPSVVIPVIIFWLGWSIFRNTSFKSYIRPAIFLLIFALYTSVILALPEETAESTSIVRISLSGLVGSVIAKWLLEYLGIAGSIVLLLSLIMTTLIFATNLSISGGLTGIGRSLARMFNSMGHVFRNLFSKLQYPRKAVKKRITYSSEKESIPPEKEAFKSITKISEPQMAQVEMDLEPEIEETALTGEPVSIVSRGNYIFPGVDLLTSNLNRTVQLSRDELNANAQILQERLAEFGVESKVVEISPGPIITRYEVEPAAGVKISRIVSLADDLALAMRAKRIRIVAPIPGKGAVGIELPNREASTVFLKDIVYSQAFKNSESPLTLALGKTISGEPYVTSLDQMPHLLIAGATGSGKSICINSIIASILFKAHPTEVQFAMIDPKRLELSVYNNLRHHHLTYREDLNEEVVTSAANAISVLKSLEVEMDQRYEILARAGVRSITEYNSKLQKGLLKNLDSEEPFEPLEYLILIIDELADLMMTAAREVEEPICRLTQMSRAVGLHLIVATQRPSVDVITGVIKANFPARIAFQVASKTDSRTILDLNGAEKLLGMGDMLFIRPGSSEPIRIHGAYVSPDEIEKIIAHIRKQPRYPKRKLPLGKEEAASGFSESGSGDSQDPLFNEALKLVVRHQQGSISLLQRRLKVGYARAARLIDELEGAGIVGPFDGSKAREVLVGEEELEEMNFS